MDAATLNVGQWLTGLDSPAWCDEDGGDNNHGQHPAEDRKRGESCGAHEYARQDASSGTKDLVPDIDTALSGCSYIGARSVHDQRGAGN